jgi:DNA-binding PadR family transcriptional regulator
MAISTLGYALLALLARRPSSGYELSQRAHRPLGHFWTAQHSQIHGELTKLTEAGAVTWVAVPGPGPRAKKIYSITESGRDALTAWVTRPPAPAPARNELLLKAYAMWTADPERARELFTTQLNSSREQLAEYEAAWDRVTGDHPGGVPARTHVDFGNYVTLRFGIDAVRTTVEWCSWVIELLDGAPDAPETGA